MKRQLFDFSDSLSTMAKERLESSAIGEMIKLVVSNKAISFTAGEPSSELLPVEQLKEAFKGVFDDPAKLCYYWSDLGHIELREWICDWMRKDGLSAKWVKPENIMMTCGSQEGISFAAEAFIDPGSYVLVENPTYMETLLSFRKQGATCIGVPIDENGIIIDELKKIIEQKKVRMLYTIPNFQNPTGYCTSRERREKVIELLSEHGIPILEDDPYHYLSYDKETPPTYMSLAGDHACVIYLGSFSKIVAPGLRCGWMVLPDQIVSKIISLRVNANLSLPILVQDGLFNMLQKIDLEAHINDLRDVYRKRRDDLCAAFEEYIVPLGERINKPEGGFFIWGNLDGIPDMFEFAKYAVKEFKVGVIPGSVFFVPGTSDQSAIRFSFAKVDKKNAVEGAKRLVAAINAYPKNN